MPAFENTTTSQDEPTFWAAVDLANAGYPVFPLAGKVPAVSGGFYAATTDVSEIALWIDEAGYAYHDIGVATGHGSGIVVIEADTPDRRKQMEERFGRPTVLSKKGGHWYFRHPRDGKVISRNIVPGLDCKADGGYVAAPPSTGKSWTAGIPDKKALPALPKGLREELHSGSGVNGQANGHDIGEFGELEGAAVIARHVKELFQGGRHEHLRHLCGALLRHGVKQESAERMIVRAWQLAGGDLAERATKEVPNTLRTTAAALANGGATGIPSMEKLTPGLFGELEHILTREGVITRGRVVKTPKAPDTGDDPGPVKLLADAITSEDHFAQDAGGKLYRFSGGVYKQYAERFIRRRVKELCEAWGLTNKWSSHKANEVVEYIRADAPELWEKPPVKEINVLNGILNVRTRKLRDHDPGFLSPVQLPVSYDPEATCSEWDKFVKTVFPSDAQAIAYEIPADLMLPDRSIQKAILLLGEGSNGKSTYLAAVEAFIGSTNSSGLSLHKMETDRFAVSRLAGKLANICPDLPSVHLTETSMFKAITGGDAVNAEYKYRDSFEFRPFCRLVFSANHVPRSHDASHAFFRRWLVVPFDRTIEESEQIPREELDAKLQSPEELSGVLNKALDALPRLRKNGFMESKSMRDAWEEFKAMTDPVSVWLDHHTVAGPEIFVPKQTLLDAYNDHCRREGRAGMTPKAFTQALKRARPTIEEAQRTVNGVPKTWVWVGIGLKNDGGDDAGGALPPEERHSRDSRLSSNCFLFEETPQKEDETGDKDAEITNKGKVVNVVNPVTPGEDLPTLQRALDALRHGNGPRKALEHYYDNDTPFEYVIRAVMAYWTRNYDSVADWEPAVIKAVGIISREKAVGIISREKDAGKDEKK